MAAYFAQPGAGAEFFDEASKRAYIPQRGVFYTPTGEARGSSGTINDSNIDGYAAPISAYVGYDFEPGRYKDNQELNNTPYDVMDATTGDAVYQDVFRGLSAKWDALNLAVPALAMLAAGGLTIAGLPAAGASGAGVAAGATEPVASLAVGELGGLSASELAAMEAGMLGGVGTPVGAEALAAYASLPTASLEAVAGAIGMTPEAFAALGEMGLGAAGAAAGMTAGTAAPAAVTSSAAAKSLLGHPLLDKIGGVALSALLTGAMGSAASGGGGGGPTTSVGGDKPEMPDPVGMDARRAASMSLMEQLARRGRASTILTRTGGGLGG